MVIFLRYFKRSSRMEAVDGATGVEPKPAMLRPPSELLHDLPTKVSHQQLGIYHGNQYAILANSFDPSFIQAPRWCLGCTVQAYTAQTLGKHLRRFPTWPSQQSATYHDRKSHYDHISLQLQRAYIMGELLMLPRGVGPSLRGSDS